MPKTGSPGSSSKATQRAQRAVAERLEQFGLKLHPDKTRLIEFGRFARENRRRAGHLRAVVAGHGRYFGVPPNGARLRAFRHQVVELWHRTLCRRSQSRSVRWRRMYRLMKHWLPIPKICHPYPNQRLIVITQGRSRMR